LQIPVLITKVAFYSGISVSLTLIIWSSFLYFQHTRLSLETSAATLILAVMILFSLIFYSVSSVVPTERQTHIKQKIKILRFSASVIAALLMLAITFSLLPMNYGLEAPGFTASVEPMVQIPQEYRHSSKGNFLISSVILQAPILTGEWVYGHLDHTIKLMPQERIVPVTTTVQAVAQTDYKMLLDSETTACIVGLQMAGYPAGVVGNNINMPFPVKIVHQKTDGGPSAGLMFTLGVYDILSQQDLTGGRKIAGTGTIDLNGNVGPVGGVEQKVVAAEHAGAQYFLTSSWNYQSAMVSAKHLKVVKVDTVQEAIDFLKSLPPLPASPSYTFSPD
jgi:PDZ domain-containing secreted protein